MPEILIALLLGTVQGLTEFLPVSSSGHLAILQGFFGEKWIGDLVFDVSVHLGTTLAVVVFFFREIIDLIKGIIPGHIQTDKVKIVGCILLTTIVTGILGLVFRNPFESLFSMPKLAAAMLLVTGILTFLTDRMKSTDRPYGRIRFIDAVIIGLFQAIAIIPGISRSGSTIFAGVALGMDRTWAASYSFIAAIPVILGAVALEWSGADHGITICDVAGTLTAFIVGLISLKFLVWTLRRHNFFIFSVYCWLVGIIYLAASMV